jgi:hypothetical protein
VNGSKDRRADWIEVKKVINEDECLEFMELLKEGT